MYNFTIPYYRWPHNPYVQMYYDIIQQKTLPLCTTVLLYITADPLTPLYNKTNSADTSHMYNYTITYFSWNQNPQ